MRSENVGSVSMLPSSDSVSRRFFSLPWGLRKFLWTLLIAGGLCMSAKDTYTAVCTYLRQPISTSNMLRYPHQVTFPNLILCNSNQFRVTQTQGNLYKMITDAFNKIDNKSNFHIDQFKDDIELAVNKTETWEAFGYRMQAAHKIEDMVIKCQTWTGKNCSANFTTEIYDYGVCYKFNGSQWPFVTQSGSGQSLTIFLNLESYEHMQGPAQFLNSLKVTIVHKDAFPYVTARGFDIVPGYVSMVSLKYKEFKRVLSKNGGTCIEQLELDHFSEEQYSADTCQLDMGFTKVEKLCYCKAYNSTKNGNASTFCNLYQYFNCVIWQDLSINNGTYQCQEACLSIEYPIFVSQSKISSAIWPTLISNYQEKKIRNTFNVSQEAYSRNDQTRVNLLNYYLNTIQNASAELKKLNMEAPAMVDGIAVFPAKDAKEPIEKTNVFACYTKIKQHYQWLFRELQNKKLISITCPFDSQDAASTQAGANSISFEDQIRTVLQNENRWTAWRMDNAFSTRNTFNQTHYLYKDKLEDVVKLLTEVASVFVAPWCLNKLTSLNDYWIVGEYAEKYIRKNITLKEWVDNHPTGVGDQYRRDYAWQFTAAIRAALTRIRVLAASSDFTGFVNQTDFWNYFGYYLAASRDIYNKSLCDNVTNANSMQCLEFPFYSIESFYSDSTSCIVDDFLNKTRKFRGKILVAATSYKESMAALDNFLMAYGQRWEFGDNFFANNIVGLKIFFADLSQEIVTEEVSYDLSIMFGNIGGSVGLFIGASVLSIFELLDMILFEIFRAKRQGENRVGTI